MFVRGRRLRKKESIRNLVEETTISVNDLIFPIFLIDGKNKTEDIPSMPGVQRKTLDLHFHDINQAIKLGINAVILFPVIPKNKKNKKATEAINKNGLLPLSIKKIKKEFPELVIISDIALDPFNSDGHDGLVYKNEVLNDKTVDILCKQAIIHAQSGVDIVAPSDMMDGRVLKIRQKLDSKGFHDISIMSYAAKFASSLYGPFRDALNSSPKKGDKKTYQINPANSREAIKEILYDEAEGADMLIVKPASFYLDVIKEARDSSLLPIVAYQVSGEYSMIRTAADKGYLDLNDVMHESLLSIKRAGADMIITYFALEYAKLIRKN
jgi:porphobilinogen synthase